MSATWSFPSINFGGFTPQPYADPELITVTHITCAQKQRAAESAQPNRPKPQRTKEMRVELI